MNITDTHLLRDEHLLVLSACMQDAIKANATPCDQREALISRVIAHGLETLDADEARALAQDPEALRALAPLLATSDPAAEGLWSQDTRQPLLAAASPSRDAFQLYIGVQFEIWCTPRVPDGRVLLTLRTLGSSTKRNDLYVYVTDTRGNTLLEGEIVEGELHREIANLGDYVGPFDIKFRILG